MAAATLASVGAVIALATGVTFGLFSATSPSQSDAFTAGTVTLSQPADVACTIDKVMPGDSNTSQCTFSIDYTGNVPAYLAADVTVDGTAAASVPDGYGYSATPKALYDGTTGGLGLTLKSGSTTFMSGQTVNGSTLATGDTVNDLLVSTTPDPDSSVTPTTHTFTVGYSLPQDANNDYQGGSATITVVVHAVQADNNTAVAACATAGLACATPTDWS